jgi:REP element-mobilizing transposase RayT
MPRSARRFPWTQAACYHVLNRGHARETIIHDDADRLRFLELVARYRDRFAFRLYHYGLMDNHFHLLLQLPDPRIWWPVCWSPTGITSGVAMAWWDTCFKIAS